MIKLTRTKTYNGAGIYMIQSSINDKVYIGQSVNISKRVFNAHINLLLAGKHDNRHLQNHVNKHLPDYNSIEDFLEFSIVWRSSRNMLTEKEQEWIDKFPKKQRFNICDKAEVPPKWDDYSKEKQTQIKAKLRLAWEKRKEAGVNPETRIKQRKAANKNWDNLKFKEKHHKAMKLIWNDPEYRKKQSKINKERWADPEYRKKQNKALNLALHNPETIAKKSIAMKASWAKRKAAQQKTTKMQRTIFHNQN
jgi:group I intron endonuclease